MIIYRYGMRLRGFSPGAQPMNNFIYAKPGGEVCGKAYHNFLYYLHPIPLGACRQYSLDYLDKVEVIMVADMEKTDCPHCRFCVERGGHAWCAAQSGEGIHYIDLAGRGSWPPGFREDTCPLEG